MKRDKYEVKMPEKYSEWEFLYRMKKSFREISIMLQDVHKECKSRQIVTFCKFLTSLENTTPGKSRYL